jgi:hypothetical protein
MKHTRGYVDAKGVHPGFSQSFVPSSDAVVIDEESGIVHLTTLGRLKQTHDSSITTYDHVEIDVRNGGTPIKDSTSGPNNCGAAFGDALNLFKLCPSTRWSRV